jgi:hypothetical protein
MSYNRGKKQNKKNTNKISQEEFKKIVYVAPTSNLPKRSQELTDQLAQGSERLITTFSIIKDELKLNDVQTWSFFKLVTAANNEFMMNPNTTLQTFLSFEEIMWAAARQIKQ